MTDLIRDLLQHPEVRRLGVSPAQAAALILALAGTPSEEVAGEDAFCLAHQHASREEEAICSLRFQLAAVTRERDEARKALVDLIRRVEDVGPWGSGCPITDLHRQAVERERRAE